MKYGDFGFVSTLVDSRLMKGHHLALCYKTGLIYVMLVFAGEAHYHIGIWYCVTAGVS